MEVGQADVAGLAQVLQARLVATEQDLAHAEPQVDVGLHRPLLAVAHRGDGVAERPIARRVAAQDLAQVGHGRGVERLRSRSARTSVVINSAIRLTLPQPWACPQTTHLAHDVPPIAPHEKEWEECLGLEPVGGKP